MLAIFSMSRSPGSKVPETKQLPGGVPQAFLLWSFRVRGIQHSKDSGSHPAGLHFLLF